MFKNKLIIFKKKFARNFRDYGFFICLKKTIFYLARPIYEKTNVVLFKTDIKNIVGKELYQSNLNFKWVESKDTYIIKQIEEMEEWLTGKLESYVGNNKLCLTALKNNEVIGFYLISFSDIYLPLLCLKVLLKDDEAFGEQITVHKKYRRKEIATEMRSVAYMELKKRGIKTIYSAIFPYNVASLKSNKRGGGKRIGQLLYKNIFQSRQLCFIKNSGKKIFIETKEDSSLSAKNNEKDCFITDTSYFNSWIQMISASQPFLYC